jgi:hypothetical protein
MGRFTELVQFLNNRGRHRQSYSRSTLTTTNAVYHVVATWTRPHKHGKMEQIRLLEPIPIAKSVRKTKVKQIGRKYELILRRIYVT